MSKPLTIEQIRALKEDDWIWIENLGVGDSFYAAVTDTAIGNSAEVLDVASAGFYQTLVLEEYGTRWLAYKNKEEARIKWSMLEEEFITYLGKKLLYSGEDCCSICANNLQSEGCKNLMKAKIDDEICINGLRKFAENKGEQR